MRNWVAIHEKEGAYMADNSSKPVWLRVINQFWSFFIEPFQGPTQEEVRVEKERQQREEYKQRVRTWEQRRAEYLHRTYLSQIQQLVAQIDKRMATAQKTRVQWRSVNISREHAIEVRINRWFTAYDGNKSNPFESIYFYYVTVHPPGRAIMRYDEQCLGATISILQELVQTPGLLEEHLR